MGNQFLITMKFTSVAVLALFLADTSAVKLQGDDCARWGGKNGLCNHGLSYDLDKDTLDKAQAHNDAATQHFNGATKADADAKAALAGATADAAAKASAAASAASAKAGTQGAWANVSYSDA